MLLKQFQQVMIVENTFGQLYTKIRAEFLVDADLLPNLGGMPFRVGEIEQNVHELLGDPK